jgi:hypothetical protein
MGQTELRPSMEFSEVRDPQATPKQQQKYAIDSKSAP